MLTEAVRIPGADGANVTLIVQLAPPKTTIPHVLACEKSVAFCPVIEMANVKGALPVLVNVLDMGALTVPKF